MVPGIDSFREKFKDYTDYYTIIGGTACDILLSEADLPFRATKDIDMILIMEDNFPEFASVFWEYIKEGGYKCGWKNEQNMHFYRFTEGKFGYPTMIELFSRKPGYHLEIEEGIIPIHIDDDTSSLSAILLNDDFYKFMMSGRRVVDGIGVLGAEHLIPFKMYAWINLWGNDCYCWRWCRPRNRCRCRSWWCCQFSGTHGKEKYDNAVCKATYFG